MHVALIIYGSLDALSGGYLYDRKLVAHLWDQGDTVKIISLPRTNYLLHLTHNFSPRLRHRLVRLNADVLLQDELNHPSLFALNNYLHRHIDYPIVSIVHHARSSEEYSTWQRAFYSWIERRYLSSVDALIYNSRTTQQLVERFLTKAGAQNLPGLVAYPGGDRFHSQISNEEIRHRAQDELLRVVFLGSLIPRKGLHILLDALARLPADHWGLTVIGSQQANPSYAQLLRRQVARDGLAERVRFCGALSDLELTNCLRASHLLVVPSSYEGYGIAYSEAMSFGLPAIGTTAGAAWEIITHGHNGFLIAPGDVTALGGYLAELAQDRERLIEMSFAARARYRSLPTWGESLERTRAFLAELVGDA